MIAVVGTCTWLVHPSWLWLDWWWIETSWCRFWAIWRTSTSPPWWVVRRIWFASWIRLLGLVSWSTYSSCFCVYPTQIGPIWFPCTSTPTWYVEWIPPYQRSSLIVPSWCVSGWCSSCSPTAPAHPTNSSSWCPLQPTRYPTLTTPRCWGHQLPCISTTWRNWFAHHPPTRLILDCSNSIASTCRHWHHPSIATSARSSWLSGSSSGTVGITPSTDRSGWTSRWSYPSISGPWIVSSTSTTPRNAHLYPLQCFIQPASLWTSFGATESPPSSPWEIHGRPWFLWDPTSDLY